MELIHNVMNIDCVGNLRREKCEFSVIDEDESIVGYQQKKYSSWSGLIGWNNLLRNISDLIKELSDDGLKYLEEDMKEIYEELSVRGFLIEEVKEFLTKKSSGHGQAEPLI